MQVNYSQCTKHKKKSIILLQIKKREQIRFKQYWKSLQSQNSELIHKIAEQIKKINKQQCTEILKTLNQLLSQPRRIQGILPRLKQLTNVLMKMLKTAILDALSNLSADERKLYSEISKMSIRLIENSIKQKGSQKQPSDYTIEKLFHLDVISLLLKQNQIFKKEWWHFQNLWSGEELQEISLILNNTVFRFYKRHQSYSDCLRFQSNHKKINDIITVLTLVKIKARLLSFFRQDCGQFPFLQDIQNERQQREIKRQESQNSDNQSDFEFNFCQLANYSIQNQVQQPPSNCKGQFYSTLHSIMKQQSLWGKKYLILSAKINYKISIRSILKSLSHFRQIDEQQFTQHLEKALLEENEAKFEEVKAEMNCDTFMDFQDKWRYIFLKKYTVREAFDKYGISKDLNVVIASNQSCHMHRRFRNYIFVASLGRYYDHSRYVQTILFLESRICPFVAIKKYEITYQNMKTESISEEQTQNQSRTLIIATINSKVFFFYFLNEKVNCYEYFRKIRQGVKQNPIHSKFTAILFEYNFKQIQSPFIMEYQRFGNYLTNYYGSRAYVSSYNKYCDQNLFIFTYLSCQLKKISKKVTKDKFDETLEDEVKNVLTFFK